jgi:hypothetical protein
LPPQRAQRSIWTPNAREARVSPACLIGWREIAWHTTPSTSVSAAASLASRKRNACGSESTHCLSGRSGRTSSASVAGVSAMRRAPHEVQKPRALHLSLELLLNESCKRPASLGPPFAKRGVLLLDGQSEQGPGSA